MGRVTTGRIDRLAFVMAGVVLFLVKCVCDTVMAAGLLGKTWSIAYYL